MIFGALHAAAPTPTAVAACSRRRRSMVGWSDRGGVSDIGHLWVGSRCHPVECTIPMSPATPPVNDRKWLFQTSQTSSLRHPITCGVTLTTCGGRVSTQLGLLTWVFWPEPASGTGSEPTSAWLHRLVTRDAVRGPTWCLSISTKVCLDRGSARKFTQGAESLHATAIPR